MKFILSSLLVVSSFSSFGAAVVRARLDANKKNILVDVRYGGGCKKHTFDLQIGACLESLPVQCSADLVETIEGGFDACEAIKMETAVFNLKKYGLNEQYFSGGSFHIRGGRGFDGKATSVTVTLP